MAFYTKSRGLIWYYFLFHIQVKSIIGKKGRNEKNHCESFLFAIPGTSGFYFFVGLYLKKTKS